MQCFRCQAENADGSKFCGNCGAQFGRLTDPTREIPKGSPPPDADLPALTRGGTPQGWGQSSASLDGSLRVPVSKGARVVTIVIFLVLDAAMVIGGLLLWRARGAGGDDAAVAAPDAMKVTRVLADGGLVVVEVPRPIDAGRRGSSGSGSGVHIGTGGGSGTGSGTGTGGGTGGGTGSGTGTGTGTGTGGGSVSGAPDAGAEPDPDPDAGAGSGTGTGTGTGTGVDPAPDAGLGGNDDVPGQVNAQHSKSRARLGRCYTNATKGLPDDQPLEGEVDIAFEVMPTGEVKNIQVVRNTTLSKQLSDCLVAIVIGWTVPPFAGESVDLKKTFAFHPS